MAITRIQIAKADIVRYFDELPQKLFKSTDLSSILSAQRDFWRLAQRTNTSEFVDFLIKHGRLTRLVFHFGATTPEFPYDASTSLCFIWGNIPLEEALLTLRPRSYFSHYTAMRFHGLTEQAPKTLYLTHEKLPYRDRARDVLKQGAIDEAFRKPARTTQEIAEYQQWRICLISGIGTGELGVIDGETTSENTTTPAKIRVTNLERTLIDLTVRPVYSGGAAEVLKAFEAAKPKISVNRLRAMLQKLNYLYPFHQAVGFYLERAGYKAAAIDLFRQLPQQFDFYLTHAMEETDYVPQWRLSVPKGL